MKKTYVLLLLIVSLPLTATDYDYQTWKNNRLKGLQQPHSWLSLVGLEWLKKGENSMGAADDNDIKLSHGPDYMGVFTLSNNGQLTFTANSESEVLANEQKIVDKITVYADTHEQGATVFTADTFLFYVVEREKLALRIKDSEAKTRTEFKGLSYFPEDEKFRIDATFVPYVPAKIIPTVNVLGILSHEESPGRLEFSIDGKPYSLDALNSEDAYYMIFADRTNGKTTYGPGRFVYTDGKVNEQGIVTIDFNKSYNPPCAFTAYSTCTLPPLQNRLNTAIVAGELKYIDSVY
jgi:hypothetical protein